MCPVSTAKAATSATEVADFLRREITAGRLAPGAAIRQEELAAQLGLSRIPIREAFSRLEAEGLVVVRPNRGAFVSELSAGEIEEIFELRVYLEVEALRHAVPKHTSRTLRQLDNLQRELATEDLPDRWLELDEAFHDGLYVPSGRRHTLVQIGHLRTLVKRYYISLMSPSANREDWNQHHRSILQAVGRQSTTDAVHFLQKHLRETSVLTLEQLTAKHSQV